MPSFSRRGMRITVGFLATSTGYDGIQLAISLARLWNASLELVCIVKQELPGAVPGRMMHEKKMLEQAKEWLDEGAQNIPDDIPTSKHAVLAESPAVGLIDFAVLSNSDMIVVGGTSDGLLRQHALGGISQQLVQTSPIPVALAPRGYMATFINRVTIAVPHSESANARATTDALLNWGVDMSTDQRLPIRVLAEEGVNTQSSLVDAFQIQAQIEREVDPQTEVKSYVGHGPSVKESVASMKWNANDFLLVGEGALGEGGGLLGMKTRIQLAPSAASVLKTTRAPMMVVPQPR